MSKNKLEVNTELLREYIASHPEKAQELGKVLTSLDKNKTPDLSKEFSSLSQKMYSAPFRTGSTIENLSPISDITCHFL